MSRFQKVVQKSESIKAAYRDGLGALIETDRNRIEVANIRHLTGSVDIDNHLRNLEPYRNATRWDYLIGYQYNDGRKVTEVVYIVEVHPATEGEVSKVVKKLAWLKSFINAEVAELAQIKSRIFWISSGKTSISPTSKKRRILALNGIELAGKKLRIG
ncbi:MAG: hypothetical protein ACKN9S_01780 [Pirellula sp.]